MILVYQMLKVASRAWVEAARAAAPDQPEPVHVHFVNPGTLARIAALPGLPPAQQTIANRFMLRDMLRKGEIARAAIERARQSGKRIRVISGMRDPVARSLSLVHFFADFYGDSSRPLDRSRGGNGAATAATVLDFWHAVLAEAEPADSFARLLTLLIGAYRTWFADELEAVLGMRLGTTAFPVGAGFELLRGDGVEVLLYRVEDLAPQAAGHAALLAAAAAFVGGPVPALPLINTAASRRSHARYAAANAALRLPADLLERIYSARVVSRFYSAAEIEAFSRRWRTHSRN